MKKRKNKFDSIYRPMSEQNKALKHTRINILDKTPQKDKKYIIQG